MKKPIGYYRPCDLLTMTGTCFAFLGTAAALLDHYTLPFLCLAASGLCDAFDGKLARRHVYDDRAKTYGVQLDSLSDAFCFGAYPALLTLCISRHWATAVIGTFYLLCAIVRLAYFNTLASDENAEKGVFIGVPTTMVAVVYPPVAILIFALRPALLEYVMPAMLAVLGLLFILPIRIKKPDITVLLKKIFNKYTDAFLFFPLYIVAASDVYYDLNFGLYSVVPSVFSAMFGHLLPFLFILAYVSLAVFALTALLKSSKRAKIVSVVILTVLLTVNDIKLTIMNLPLQLSDVNYLNPNNIDMMGTAAGTIGVWIINVALKSVVVLLVGAAFVFADRLHPIKIDSLKIRLLSLVAAAVLLVMPMQLANGGSKILLSLYGVSQEDCESLEPTKVTYVEYGLYEGMYIDYFASKFVVPEGYDRDAADAIMASGAQEVTNGAWGKANVVFILGEAFSDVENMSEVEFDRNLTPNIDAFAQDDDKIVTDLHVSTFGGASVNSEFEVLTGSSLALWPTNYIPYNSYVDDENGDYIPTVLREFSNNGYETMYITPWGDTSFRSRSVYTAFGADKLMYGDSLTGERVANCGLYSDTALMDDIMSELTDTAEGDYKFIMSATAVNHFPYYATKYAEYDVDAYSDTLNEEQLAIMRAYAQGIYSADNALGYLYEKIQTLDVPTVVVFFGDHLPHAVDSEGNNVYLTSQYFNTPDANLNTLRSYTTKAVIFANYPIETDDLEYINASYLGAYVLNKMDLQISDYFKYIERERTKLPVFDKNCVYKDGTITTVADLSQEMSGEYTGQKYVKYRMFYDYAQ